MERLGYLGTSNRVKEEGKELHVTAQRGVGHRVKRHRLRPGTSSTFPHTGGVTDEGPERQEKRGGVKLMRFNLGNDINEADGSAQG